MVRRKADVSTDNLKKELELCRALVELQSKRLSEVAATINQDFSTSSARYFLLERIEYLEMINQLDKTQNAYLEGEKIKLSKELSALRSQSPDGTEESFSSYDVCYLKDKVSQLEGDIASRNATIQKLTEQIEIYQKKCADMAAQLAKCPPDADSEALHGILQDMDQNYRQCHSDYQSLILEYADLLQKLITLSMKSRLTPHSLKTVITTIMESSPHPSALAAMDSVQIRKMEDENVKLKEQIDALSRQVPKGRPVIYNEDTAKQIMELRKQNYSYRKISELLGCSPATISRILKSAADAGIKQ